MSKKGKSYFTADVGTKDRFRQNHFPTYITFGHLFDSVPFFLESGSTAGASAQGLVKKASDTKAVARNSTVDTDGFTQTVQAHHLPFFEALNVTTGIALVESSSSLNRSGGSGSKWTIENTLAISSVNTITVTQVNPGDNAVIEVSALSINTAEIAADAITEAKIADNAVKKEHINSDIAGDGITHTAGVLSVDADNTTLEVTPATSLHIKALGVDTGQIAALAVTNAKIAANTINQSNMGALSVGTPELIAVSVTTAKIAALAVDTGQIAANAVTTAKIAALNVTAAEIASNAVTTAKILDVNVTTPKIANLAVTEAKIGAGAITTAKIGSEEIKETNIDNSFTKGVLNQIVSFETGELGLHRIYIPFNATIDYVRFIVTKAFAAGDAGTLLCELDGAAMDSINIPLSTIVGTEFSDGGLGNNVVTNDPVQVIDLDFTSSKVTPGGIISVSIGYTINDES